MRVDKSVQFFVGEIKDVPKAASRMWIATESWGVINLNDSAPTKFGNGAYSFNERSEKQQ
jgi:hypothetical protein